MPICFSAIVSCRSIFYACVNQLSFSPFSSRLAWLAGLRFLPGLATDRTVRSNALCNVHSTINGRDWRAWAGRPPVRARLPWQPAAADLAPPPAISCSPPPPPPPHGINARRRRRLCCRLGDPAGLRLAAATVSRLRIFT